jgi:hypothetical protein
VIAPSRSAPLVAGIAVVLVAVALGWRLTHQRCTFQIHNSAAVAVQDVVVSVAGKKVATGPLQPGASVTVRAWVPRRRGLMVSVYVGTAVSFSPCMGCGVPHHLTVNVAPDFSVSYEFKAAV